MFKLFSKNKIKTLTIENIVHETSDTISLYFSQPAKEKINYKPGQFLTLIVPIGNEKLRRSYSMSSSPIIDNTICVTIKTIPNGKVSNYLKQQAKEGQEIEYVAPAGNFYIDVDEKKSRHVVLIGAGSGITPLLSIAKSVLSTETDSIVSLIYGNRNENSIIFKEKLIELQNKYKNRFNVEHVLSQPDNKDWKGKTGRLNRHTIIKILDQFPKMEESIYFLCGPIGMMEEALDALSISGVERDLIHKESFVTEDTATAHGLVVEKQNVNYEEQEVTVIYDGAEYKFKVPSSKTILEAALDNNIDLPYSCQSGLCTACRGKCVSGKVKLDEEDGLSNKEREMGYVLTCVGHPITSDVVIEIG